MAFCFYPGDEVGYFSYIKENPGIAAGVGEEGTPVTFYKPESVELIHCVVLASRLQCGFAGEVLFMIVTHV